MKYTLDVLGSMVELKVKLRKVGGSLTITVPTEIIEALGFKEGDILKADAKDGKLVVEKKEEN